MLNPLEILKKWSWKNENNWISGSGWETRTRRFRPHRQQIRQAVQGTKKRRIAKISVNVEIFAEQKIRKKTYFSKIQKFS